MQTFHCMNFYNVIFVSFFNPLAYSPFFCSNYYYHGEGLGTMKSQDGIEKIIVFDCCKLVTAQETNKLDKRDIICFLHTLLLLLLLGREYIIELEFLNKRIVVSFPKILGLIFFE